MSFGGSGVDAAGGGLLRRAARPRPGPLEAGPTGFGLARALEAQGVDCVMAAPARRSRTPRQGSELRRYSIPPGHDEALLDESGLNYIAPLGRLVVAACTHPLEAVVEAFRTGEGVPYAAYGADPREGQARFTRPMFDNLIGSDWLPAIPDIDARLRSDPTPRASRRPRRQVGKGRALVAGQGPQSPVDLPARRARRGLAGQPPHFWAFPLKSTCGSSTTSTTRPPSCWRRGLPGRLARS